MVPDFGFQKLLRHWCVRLRVPGRPTLSSTKLQQKEDKGFALLVVVVVLVALSLMMGAVISATQNFAQITASHLAMLQLRAALDGGLVTAEHELSSPALQNAQLSKSAEIINFGTVAVEIRIRPEVAKVDINNARPELIAQLLRNSGLSPTYSKRIADEIAVGPLSDNEVKQEGPPNSPIRIKFDTLSELTSLKDGNGDLLTCLAPDTTVFTHSPDVDSP
jgi:type II secretory pathway component PulK